jgi:hypothetical protein
MKLDQLRAFAAEKGIPFPANATKAVLISLIEDADLEDKAPAADADNAPAAE